MSNKVERRSFTDLRAESQGDEFSIVGYASLYNVPSKDLGGFREIVQPGAFDRSLAAGQNVSFCFNHSQDAILARVDNGTLALTSDDKGLRFRAKLNPKIQMHRDVYEACRSGLYRECSFAFTVQPDGEKWAGTTRTLTDVKLFDVSLVGAPAYPGTAASARSADTIPTTAELRARLKKLDGSAFAKEDAERRARAEKLGKEINGKAVGDGKSLIACSRSLDDEKQQLLDALQDLADERYGPRYRVVDADCSEGSRCGTAIMRDMLADDESFYGVDYEEDEPDEDEDDQRSLKPEQVSSARKLRFTSYRRKVSPSGTTWSKSARAVRAYSEWWAGRSERDLKRRMESASR